MRFTMQGYRRLTFEQRELLWRWLSFFALWRDSFEYEFHDEACRKATAHCWRRTDEGDRFLLDDHKTIASETFEVEFSESFPFPDALEAA